MFARKPRDCTDHETEHGREVRLRFYRTKPKASHQLPERKIYRQHMKYLIDINIYIYKKCVYIIYIIVICIYKYVYIVNHHHNLYKKKDERQNNVESRKVLKKRV